MSAQIASLWNLVIHSCVSAIFTFFAITVLVRIFFTTTRNMNSTRVWRKFEKIFDGQLSLECWFFLNLVTLRGMLHEHKPLLTSSWCLFPGNSGLWSVYEETISKTVLYSPTCSPFCSNAKHGGGRTIPHLNFSIPCAALLPIFRFSGGLSIKPLTWSKSCLANLLYV